MESLKEVIERGEDSLRVLFSLWENEMMTCEDKSESI